MAGIFNRPKKMKQLSHNEIKNTQRQFPITIVCDAIRTPENIGMCFRIAESFGVQKIYLHESSPNHNNRIVQRTARNTLNEVPFEVYDDFDTIVNQLKTDGNIILGIEITDKSIPLQQYDFTQHKKIALLLGSERNGIENINVLNESIAIPMFGKNSSINVIHSLAITLYEVTNQLSN